MCEKERKNRDRKIAKGEMKKITPKNEKRGGKDEKREGAKDGGEDRERLALAHLGCPEW